MPSRVAIHNAPRLDLITLRTVLWLSMELIWAKLREYFFWATECSGTLSKSKIEILVRRDRVNLFGRTVSLLVLKEQYGIRVYLKFDIGSELAEVTRIFTSCFPCVRPSCNLSKNLSLRKSVEIRPGTPDKPN